MFKKILFNEIDARQPIEESEQPTPDKSHGGAIDRLMSGTSEQPIPDKCTCGRVGNNSVHRFNGEHFFDGRPCFQSEHPTPDKSLEDVQANWKRFYEEEIDRQDKLAKQLVDEGDQYGKNFHQGKRSGLIEADIWLHQFVKEAVQTNQERKDEMKTPTSPTPTIEHLCGESEWCPRYKVQALLHKLTAALARVAEVEQQNRTNATELYQIRPMRYENERLTEELTATLRELDALRQAIDNCDISTNVRQFDLVRFMRAELHEQGLIDDMEYGWLCGQVPMATSPNGGSPSPRRLEDYDQLKQRNAELLKIAEELYKQIGCGCGGDKGLCNDCDSVAATLDNFKKGLK